MKKWIAGIFAICMMAVMAVPAFAASVSKQDIIDEVRAGIEVGETVVKFPEEYIKVGVDFLNANEFTEAELNEAMQDIKEAKKVWAGTGKTDFREMPADVQKQLQNMAVESAKKLGATLTIGTDSLKLVDKNGKVFTVQFAAENPVKPTGANGNVTAVIVASAAVLTVLGAGVVLSRKHKLFSSGK